MLLLTTTSNKKESFVSFKLKNSFHSDDLETPVDSAVRFPQNGSDVIFDNLQVGTDYVITLTSQYDGLMRIEETVNVTTGFNFFWFINTIVILNIRRKTFFSTVLTLPQFKIEFKFS